MPTLTIDEGDFKDTDESQELIKFFNLGFEKNNRMFNCDKNNPDILQFNDPYCPKIMTRRRQYKDQALEARCITEIMRQTIRKDIPPLLTKAFYDKQAELRNKLLKFRFDYWNKVKIDDCANIDLGDIEPRIKQASLAFTTLFANIPEALESFKTFIKKYNDNVIEERAISFDGLIVNIAVDLILEGKKSITSKDITIKMQEANIQTTNATVGKHLTQLGIGTISKKVDDKTLRIIPLNNAFLGVVKRYSSDQKKVAEIEKVVTEVTGVTVVTSTSKHDDETQQTLTFDINNNKKIKSDIPVSAVTPVTRVTENTPEVPQETKVSINNPSNLLEFIKKNPDTSFSVIMQNVTGLFDETGIMRMLQSLNQSGDIVESRPDHWRALE